MDHTHSVLQKMVVEQPNCINDKKHLKAVLLDYLPQNKLQQNLILNAFDEGIISRLQSSTDVTLQALQMVKILMDGYGLTWESAMWTVTAWCKMIKLDETAEVIEEAFHTEQSLLTSTQNSYANQSSVKTTVGLGMYKAGLDIPYGELRIKRNQKSEYKIWYGIAKNPNRIDANKDFMNQTYITIEKDQYLKLECCDTKSDNTMTLTKI